MGTRLPSRLGLLDARLCPSKEAKDFHHGLLTRLSHQLTVEACDRPAIIALRLFAVLNVLSRSDAERKSLLISVAPRYEWARLHPQKYASARRAARAFY